MSKKRQSATFDPVAGKAEIATHTHDYPGGKEIALHFHQQDQLVYASCGVMTVSTDDGAWVVPAHRAVWIPERTPHSIAMSGRVAMRTLYLRPRLAEAMPRRCCVVSVPPLLRELILRACSAGALKKNIAWQRHLIDIIRDELAEIQVVPLQLPNVSDARAVRVATTLIADPGNRQQLARVCKSSGASRRTVERLFQVDTGMTLGKWRQQLRLMQAMRLLGEGAAVTHAALEAGYSTPSAFIAAFRKALGTTPTAYFKSSSKKHVAS
jgi:AraC-like DNA-binding protein